MFLKQHGFDLAKKGNTTALSTMLEQADLSLCDNTVRKILSEVEDI